jgi:hypothetical protein
MKKRLMVQELPVKSRIGDRGTERQGPWTSPISRVTFGDVSREREDHRWNVALKTDGMESVDGGVAASRSSSASGSIGASGAGSK